VRVYPLGDTRPPPEAGQGEPHVPRVECLAHLADLVRREHRVPAGQADLGS
jgi:hypothetical protein